MKEKLITLAVAAAIAAPMAVQAGTFTTANQDITLSGGLAGGYMNNTDSKGDAFTATDALVDLSSKAKTGGVGFDLGFGQLANATLANSAGTVATTANGGSNNFQYGYLTIMPSDNLSIQAGTLATNVGYEVVPSYANANILHGVVWNAEPAYYNGARATYWMGDSSVYAELSNQSTNNNGQAIGASTKMGSVDGSISYFNNEDMGSIVDIIASSKVGSTTVAANLDYHMLSNRVKNSAAYKGLSRDDNAFGLALYASMPMGANASLPVRIEYINDGTSGIYGFAATDTGGKYVSNNAYTITITPTYNFSDSTFVRAELAYISTDKKSGALMDDKGLPTDSNMTVGFQGGVMF
jgi:hypothetical protein